MNQVKRIMWRCIPAVHTSAAGSSPQSRMHFKCQQGSMTLGEYRPSKNDYTRHIQLRQKSLQASFQFC
eukprot:399009-Amphidinium_carterae.1